MVSLDIDLTTLWESINQYFPVFFAVLVIPAGIQLAMKLGEWIISKVTKIFG